MSPVEAEAEVIRSRLRAGSKTFVKCMSTSQVSGALKYQEALVEKRNLRVKIMKHEQQLFKLRNESLRLE
ncbi:hypothetical protein MKW94_024718 [Papaver nudicaule]|uniref:Uncharacterized protein n=1 Tax=Papaver nudicaule TaxID=74823 RepID=A0AA41SLI6_PAPNU|nr:hypothetical protein [Papaver nudicaule]